MKGNKKKIELLAPAGDIDKLKYAYAYGADAVYLGLPDFSLRAKTGFDLKSIKEGIDYAHKLKKKVYVTINIFAHNNQINKLSSFLRQISKINADAIIISDPGVLLLVKKYLPKTPIHLSTQANTLNYEAVKFWQKNGVKRVILGREATLEDIREIHRKVPKMQLEVFVHGAMCMSYSGRCYFSAWLNNRSANEGSCTQPCRWNYKLYMEEPLRPGMMIPLEEDEKGIYILNSKDLCLIDYLDELRKAGVVSVKIEGRTKSHYYVAVATKAYRMALDSIFSPITKGNPSSLLPLTKGEVGRGFAAKFKQAKAELQKIDNRGYTTGFLLGKEGIKRQEFKTSKQISDWQFVGEVIESKGKTIYFKPHNMLNVGDILELLTPEGCYRIKVKEFINPNSEKVKQVHGGTQGIYSFVLSKKCNVKWGLLRKKVG